MHATCSRLAGTSFGKTHVKSLSKSNRVGWRQVISPTSSLSQSRAYKPCTRLRITYPHLRFRLLGVTDPSNDTGLPHLPDYPAFWLFHNLQGCSDDSLSSVCFRSVPRSPFGSTKMPGTKKRTRHKVEAAPFILLVKTNTVQVEVKITGGDTRI